MIGVFFIFDINYNMIYSFLNEIINLFVEISPYLILGFYIFLHQRKW